MPNTVTLSNGKVIPLYMTSESKSNPWFEWYDKDAIFAFSSTTRDFLHVKADEAPMYINFQNINPGGPQYLGEDTMDPLMTSFNSRINIQRPSRHLGPSILDNEFTIEGWYYFHDPYGDWQPHGHMYYIQGPESWARFHIEFKTQTSIRFHFGSSGTNYNDLWVGIIPKEEWVHIAVTYDGSSIFRVWINGEYKGAVSRSYTAFSHDINTEYAFVNGNRDTSVAKYQIIERQKYEHNQSFTPDP